MTNEDTNVSSDESPATQDATVPALTPTPGRIRLGDLRVSDLNPRHDATDYGIDSIDEIGLIQPIVLWPNDEDGELEVLGVHVADQEQTLLDCQGCRMGYPLCDNRSEGRNDRRGGLRSSWLSRSPFSCGSGVGSLRRLQSQPYLGAGQRMRTGLGVACGTGGGSGVISTV